MNTALQAVTEGRAERAQDVVQVRTRDGRDMWLNCIVFPLRAPAGEIVGWEGVAMDATEIMRARRAAEEARELFRVIFESGPMPLLLYDPQTLVIEHANARASQLYGYREGELRGCFISELVAPDEWPRTQEHISRAVKYPGVSFLQRTGHRKADGTLIPVEVAGVNVEVEGKRRRIIVIRDRTELEEAQDRIKNVYRALDATPTPTAVFDSTWTVTHANPAFCRLTRFAADEAIGREFASLLDAAAGLALRQHGAEFQRGRPFQGEGGVRVKTGEVVRMSLTVTPVMESAERAGTYFASFREVQPEAAAGAQNAADAALFLDLLSHDVTNYLTAVRGYLDLVVARGGLPQASQRMAEVARTQANNALDLIRDTRKVAWLQRDPLQSLAEGDLVKVLDDALLRVEPIIRSRPFKVRKDYRVPEAPVKSPDLLREVFVNVLHNAVKFDSHPDVLIDLSIERTALEGRPFFRVRIADRAAGISDADRARIFERGFHPSAIAARHEDAIAPPGSGIGLSLCKFIVERAGGTIAAEPRIPGDHAQGTAFIVMLPAA